MIFKITSDWTFKKDILLPVWEVFLIHVLYKIIWSTVLLYTYYFPRFYSCSLRLLTLEGRNVEVFVLFSSRMYQKNWLSTEPFAVSLSLLKRIKNPRSLSRSTDEIYVSNELSIMFYEFLRITLFLPTNKTRNLNKIYPYIISLLSSFLKEFLKHFR